MLSALGVGGWHTDAASDAEELVEIAGKSCYMSFSTDLNKNLTKVGTRSNFEYVQESIIGTKHGSVLEHAYMTFYFMNVSRVFTHEMVRHRAGCSYSQTSGRYVRTDEISYWLPQEIRGTTAEAFFHAAFAMQEKWMRALTKAFDMDNLKDFARKKKLTSAFRRLLGNGQSNHIVVTCNHRALRNIIEQRSSQHAEEEMRLVFGKVFEIVSERYPSLYSDAVSEVINGYPEIKFKAEKV